MSRVLLFTGCVNQPVGYAKTPNGKGIACFFIDPDTGAVEPGPIYTDIVNPTFVALSGDGSRLAAISETEDQPTDTLSVFGVNAATGALTLLGRQSTRGTTACHCAFDASGTMVAAANYTEGVQPPGDAISVHRLDAGVPAPALTRIVHAGHGPNAARQARSHAHCVRWTPDQAYIAVVDLGIDSVRLYRATDFALASETKLPAGIGPRHIAFHPHKPIAYVMTELETGVVTLAYADGRFDILAVAPAGPGAQHGAGIAVAPGGTRLFGGDRGNHALARFAIDPVSGVARYAGSTPTGGVHPRDHAFGANGRLLAVANVHSDTVQVFTHASDGTLTPLVTIPTGTPTAVAFL
ncbi:MAG: lactonase family protein [Devosia sp.]|uniref:lactonase family protein n=1 Tax=Devosia sp. TaxID=1871048 RepID=UPI001A4EE32E|nr:lactonase family protein [Devosia sp.]MBL8598432.1 lactonase family protein [Devosia sp.]